jgi:tetratricopeptide (TPR) repeat protein
VRYGFIAAVSALLSAWHLAAGTYAVLPFFNVSQNTNLDWIGESLASSVHEALSSQGMMTLERDDRVEAYRRLSIRPYALLTRASVVKIGEELDAEQVIFGQFDVKPVTDPAVKTRGSIEITGRLLDLKHMKQGPEFRETGALEDLAALQSHLAWQMVQFATGGGAPTETEFLKRHPPVRLDAIENYIRGLLANNPDEKHRLFTQAARLDSQYSQPCFQLGRLLWSRKEYKTAAEWFQRVAPSDAHYYQANFFLGLSRYYSGDFEGAEAAFQVVAGVVPLSEVYNNLGAAQARASSTRANAAGANSHANSNDALDNFRKALEGDPGDPAYQFNVGYALWKAGNFHDASQHFRAVLEHEPDDAEASLLLARSEKQVGPRSGDARTEGLERLKSNYEESAYWQLKAVLQPGKP